MRHYYTIVDYDASDGTFLLRDGDGDTFYSHLWELKTKISENKLLGKNISVSYLKPLVYDAIDPKIEN